MKIKILFLIVISFTYESLFSQNIEWYKIPNSPGSSIKFDDCWFVDHNTGWVVKGLDVPKYIIKTTNGGLSWTPQDTNSVTFRSIGFINDLTGWVGTLTFGKVLYSTTNGGNTWINVTNFPSPAPVGICGLSVVNNIVFGAGRYDGPAVFIKSTNMGVNWTTKSLSPLANSAVDVHFFNKDTGIVVGGLGLPIYTNAVPVVLTTFDGGTTWTRRYMGTLNREWCWKISFINDITGYVAVESYRFKDTMSYLKTTDSGITWTENRVKIDTSIYHVEGIGFLNENTGWIGGFNLPETGSVSEGKTYATTNGGNNWFSVNWGMNINRIRFMNDTLGYAVGNYIYKYARNSVNINHINSQTNGFKLSQNYPNPFNPISNIEFSIPHSSFVNLLIYDLSGKEIEKLVNNNLPAGQYKIQWNAKNFASGVYYYKLTIGKFSETKKMMLIK